MQMDEYQQVAEKVRQAAEEHPEMEDILEEAAETIESLYLCWMGERKRMEEKQQDMADVVRELTALKASLRKNKKKVKG